MNGSDAMLALFCALPAAALLAFVLCWRRSRRAGGSTPLLLAGNASLLVALLGALLLGGEIYYRFCYDSTDGYDLDLVTQRWLERHYRYNDFGVRDDVDYAPRIAEGRTRLTVIGDSYSNGHGLVDVGERFVNRLRRAHPEAEVHLLGGDGQDTGQLAAALDEWLARGYELDQVVYAYCLNDISDLIDAWQAAVRHLYQEPPAFPFARSYALNTWYYRIQVAQDPALAGYFDFIAQAYRGPEWAEQQRRLRSLAERVAGAGGKLHVATFPFFERMDDPRYREVHERLDAFWRELGVPHVDLLELYRSYTAAELVVSARDTHPDAQAHALAAAAIERLLGWASGPHELDVDEAPEARRERDQRAIDPRGEREKRARQQAPVLEPTGEPVAQRRVRRERGDRQARVLPLVARPIALEHDPGQRAVRVRQRPPRGEAPVRRDLVERLVVQPAVDEPADPAGVLVDDQHAAARAQHALALAQERRCVRDVMQDVEQEQRPHRPVLERHARGVDHAIDVGIGEHVGRDHVRQHLLDESHPRPELDRQALGGTASQ
jgi:hypothetical protein